MIYLEYKQDTEYFATYEDWNEFDQYVKKFTETFESRHVSRFPEEKGMSPMEWILKHYNLYFNGLKVEA